MTASIAAAPSSADPATTVTVTSVPMIASVFCMVLGRMQPMTSTTAVNASNKIRFMDRSLSLLGNVQGMTVDFSRVRNRLSSAQFSLDEPVPRRRPHGLGNITTLFQNAEFPVGQPVDKGKRNADRRLGVGHQRADDDVFSRPLGVRPDLADHILVQVR